MSVVPQRWLARFRADAVVEQVVDALIQETQAAAEVEVAPPLVRAFQDGGRRQGAPEQLARFAEGDRIVLERAQRAAGRAALHAFRGDGALHGPRQECGEIETPGRGGRAVGGAEKVVALNQRPRHPRSRDDRGGAPPSVRLVDDIVVEQRGLVCELYRERRHPQAVRNLLVRSAGEREQGPDEPTLRIHPGYPGRVGEAFHLVHGFEEPRGGQAAKLVERNDPLADSRGSTISPGGAAGQGDHAGAPAKASFLRCRAASARTSPAAAPSTTAVARTAPHIPAAALIPTGSRRFAP